MDNNLIQKQKAILVGIDTGEYDLEHSLEELSELAKTAGAEVIGIFTQNRQSAENATFIGGGKLREIAEFAENQQADLLIFDGELSGNPTAQYLRHHRSGCRRPDNPDSGYLCRPRHLCRR